MVRPIREGKSCAVERSTMLRWTRLAGAASTPSSRPSSAAATRPGIAAAAVAEKEDVRWRGLPA